MVHRIANYQEVLWTGSNVPFSCGKQWWEWALTFFSRTLVTRSLDISYASVKSNCAQRPPAGHCGAFAYLVSPGGGALANFVWPGGRAFTYPGAASELLTRMWFSILIQLSMEDFTGNTSRLADWVIFQGREKLVEVFSGMYSRFYPCISSLWSRQNLHSERGSYRHKWINVFLLNQISFDLGLE